MGSLIKNLCNLNGKLARATTVKASLLGLISNHKVGSSSLVNSQFLSVDIHYSCCLDILEFMPFILPLAKPQF
jgi:hypothetical protein